MTHELIGQGAFDKVYRVGNMVRKSINYEGGRISTSSFREITFLSYLKHENHRNVVYPVKISDKVLYLNYGGISLKECIVHNGPFIWSELRKILVQILKALDYIHKKKLIHCDIKPDNLLMLQRNGKSIIYICDFNISSFNNGNNSGSVYTISYRPLETLNNHYDERSDIWALGCTLYELYVGKCMFHCNTRENKTIYERITDIMGTPSQDLIKKYNLEEYSTEHKSRSIGKFTDCDTLNDLLEIMLDFDIEKRPTAEQLLNILGKSSPYEYVSITPKREYLLIKYLYDKKIVSYNIMVIATNLLYWLIKNNIMTEQYIHQWAVLCCCSMLSDGDRLRFHRTNFLEPDFHISTSDYNFGLALQDILVLSNYDILSKALPWNQKTT